MSYICNVMKKRKGELTHNKETNKLQWNGQDFDSQDIYYVPSSLTDEFVEVLITRPGQKPLYIKKTWLTKDTDDIDEVTTLNSTTLDIINKVNITVQLLGDNVDARLDGSTSMSKLYFNTKQLVCPEKYYTQNVSDIDVVFYERVTSYTKTFDISLVLKTGKVKTHSCVNRKLLTKFSDWAKANGLQVFQTGPDPLPWGQIFKLKKTDDLTWKEIDEMLNPELSEDDDESEYELSEEEEDDDYDSADFEDEEEEDLGEETEEDEYDYPSGDDEDDYEPPTKKHKN